MDKRGPNWRYPQFFGYGLSQVLEHVANLSIALITKNQEYLCIEILGTINKDQKNVWQIEDRRVPIKNVFVIDLLRF